MARDLFISVYTKGIATGPTKAAFAMTALSEEWEEERGTGTFAVYILTNLKHTVLYVGMTNDLTRRITEHREGKLPGFTRQYNATKLVYWEAHPDAWSAIRREKQLKSGSRARKVALIEQCNPEWRDLYEDLLPDSVDD